MLWLMWRNLHFIKCPGGFGQFIKCALIGCVYELAGNVYDVQMFHRLLDLRGHFIENHCYPNINYNIYNNHISCLQILH